jgi:hemoglobin
MRLSQILIGLSVAFVVACGGGGKKGDTTTNTGGGEKSLYDRLGKKDAISAVVDEFVANVAADARINAMFKNADIPNLKTKLVDQICAATGGPCTYTGKTMKDAHTGMNIKDADFNALVDDLQKALVKFNVPEKEQGELLGALAKMHDDIVTAK